MNSLKERSRAFAPRHAARTKQALKAKQRRKELARPYRIQRHEEDV